jgi:diketogulonate reductase-like aldo/keto reductase
MRFSPPKPDAVCSLEGVEFLTLNNKVTMPTLGFGVWRSTPEETATTVETALRTGYRHIDTAAAYQNEREVGEGIRCSGIDRSEIFVETKVWVTDYGYDKTLHAFDKSLRKLGVDQIDLLILHQPMPRWHIQRGRSAIPKSTDPTRMAENFDVFDFQLGDDELARIEALDSGIRGGPDPDRVDPLSRSIEIPEP